MSIFIFKNYEFDIESCTAKFNYEFNNGRQFCEQAQFIKACDYDPELLDRALFLAFILIGTSYYKTFPSVDVRIEYPVDEWQAKFFDTVYQEGLGQFAFENELRREDLAHFKVTSPVPGRPVAYNGQGVLALQSGGKDSLLVATMLSNKGIKFTPWFVSSSGKYPSVIDQLGESPLICTRTIDRENIQKAISDGGLNGHVPITYIIQSLSIVQAILSGKNTIITSIGQEGEESHSKIGNLAINHQWSKTWAAEKSFADYVARYISPDIHIGSPIRQYSELKVAELFVEYAWSKFSNEFSSCNIANYQQGNDNTNLHWCCECPKCANSFLLFAPFLDAKELAVIFKGKDLFAEPSLIYTFKGLLGIDGIPKPFECVGEVGELRQAYWMAMQKGGYQPLPFDVPKSDFDYNQVHQSQPWSEKMLQ